MADPKFVYLINDTFNFLCFSGIFILLYIKQVETFTHLHQNKNQKEYI